MAAHGKGYQTERIVINVTPEQAAAVKAALKKEVQDRKEIRKELNLSSLSENDVLLDLLRRFVLNLDVDWPEHVKVQGQRSDLRK